MEEKTTEEKLIDLEAKLLEQEHRFFPVWVNFFRRNKYDKYDKRRTSTIKALIWSFIGF
ncbi:hypothetical protein [Psychroflexus sp. MES1-P1E]|uniref:hypothetical protein n=1 Tax=Psychroflexus sp. MES1-P1E TaxID=2058320 RepID=UPI0015E0F99C|nr:hypothetical protein [Psychroflexus sp. MES1-P1E]